LLGQEIDKIFVCRRENHIGTKDSLMIEQEALLTALRTVKDPELNVNVVDLGLVYSVQSHDDQVDVEMTLTSPACPVGPEILRNAVTALEKIEGISKANVKLVMSPPWSPDKMSDEARDELGMF
jgi:metal-sulfur cluster biosynthetic enzyme